MKIVSLLSISTAALMLVLTGCSKDESYEAVHYDGLDELGKITVVSREDGSGTRTAFASLLGFDTDSSESGQSDAVTADALIAEGSEAMTELVSSDKTALGYISSGVLDDSVKALNVNGYSYDEKNYPLSRSFYLTYSGELTDLERDFLSYVHGKGQDIVSKSYTPVAKSSTFLSNKASGSLTFSGSTSVAPLIRELADDYLNYNPNVSYQVIESNSSQGMNDAMAGKVDFGMSSSDLTDYQKELLDYEVIANDNIAVIVNTENPMENISDDLLNRIYVGEITEWKELNG